MIEKCVLSSAGTVKLCGFGLSATPEELNNTKKEVIQQQRVPLRAVPPEALMKSPSYSLRGDVWSYGMLVYELFNNGEKAWVKEGFEPRKIATNIRALKMPPQPEKCSNDIWEFVNKKCWARQPTDRAEATELKAFCDETLKKIQPGSESVGVGP